MKNKVEAKGVLRSIRIDCPIKKVNLSSAIDEDYELIKRVREAKSIKIEVDIVDLYPMRNPTF